MSSSQFLILFLAFVMNDIKTPVLHWTENIKIMLKFSLKLILPKSLF